MPQISQLKEVHEFFSLFLLVLNSIVDVIAAWLLNLLADKSVLLLFECCRRALVQIRGYFEAFGTFC